MKAKVTKKKPAPKVATPKRAAPKAVARKKPAKSKSSKLLGAIVAALDGKKALDLVVLDVSKQSTITDYLVLATGNSDPHLRALRIELERVLDGDKVRLVGVDQSDGSGWTVIDAFEIMIHIFTPENREKYQLERLWNDAQVVPLSSFV